MPHTSLLQYDWKAPTINKYHAFPNFRRSLCVFAKKNDAIIDTFVLLPTLSRRVQRHRSIEVAGNWHEQNTHTPIPADEGSTAWRTGITHSGRKRQSKFNTNGVGPHPLYFSFSPHYFSFLLSLSNLGKMSLVGVLFLVSMCVLS